MFNLFKRRSKVVDACLLLAHSLWVEYARKMKGQVVVAVPNRDMVLFCDSANPVALQQMQQIGQEEYTNGGNHALTLSLFAWSKSGWCVFDASNTPA